MEKLVIRLIPGHPTGKRNRAGFVFTQDPIEVEVNKDQAKLIKEDKYLVIVTKGVALEQAKAKGTQTSNKKDQQEKSDQVTFKGKAFEDTKKSEIIEILENLEIEFKKTSSKEELWDLLNQTNSQMLNNLSITKLTKEQIIEKLIEKGLKEGEDFNIDADIENLKTLL